MPLNTKTGFHPDWVSPPGETIADVLEERNESQTGLARRLGYTKKRLNQLIQGKAPLSKATALRLERVLGDNAEFWLAREARYRKRLNKNNTSP